MLTTDKGLFSVTQDPFGDWGKALTTAAAGIEQDITAGIDAVFQRVEGELRGAIRSSEWPNEVADRTSVNRNSGQYEIQIDDERAQGLEFGNDPERSPNSVLRTWAAQNEHDINDALTSAVQQAVRL